MRPFSLAYRVRCLEQWIYFFVVFVFLCLQQPLVAFHRSSCKRIALHPGMFGLFLSRPTLGWTSCPRKYHLTVPWWFVGWPGRGCSNLSIRIGFCLQICYSWLAQHRMLRYWHKSVLLHGRGILLHRWSFASLFFSSSASLVFAIGVVLSSMRLPTVGTHRSHCHGMEDP